MSDFNLYFAGSYQNKPDEYIKKVGANRLFAWYGCKSGLDKWTAWMTENPDSGSKLFVDSGAFSAHTKGISVSVDDYVSYLNNNVGAFSVIAQVDEIPGEFRKPKTHSQLVSAPENSWNNYLHMRELLVDKNLLTPIFHQGEDFKHLRRMLDARFDGAPIEYIGISPSNDVSTQNKANWFEHVFRIIKSSKNPDVKTHAYGMTALNILEQYPFYSADSTSWLINGAMGGLLTPFGTVFISSRKHTPDNAAAYQNQSDIVKDWINKHIRSYDMNAHELEEDYSKRMIFNIKYMLEWLDSYRYKGSGRYQKRLF